MTAPRPYALLAEVTYRCPLHCPYCSNPVALPVAALLGEAPRRPQGGGYSNGELTTDEWKRVIREAAALGVLQIGFSGGEPLARRDLAELVRAARDANLYTNLITSGIGLDDYRVCNLRDAGLDSVQLSFQSDQSDLSDEIAGAHAHRRRVVHRPSRLGLPGDRIVPARLQRLGRRSAPARPVRLCVDGRGQPHIG